MRKKELLNTLTKIWFRHIGILNLVIIIAKLENIENLEYNIYRLYEKGDVFK